MTIILKKYDTIDMTGCDEDNHNKIRKIVKSQGNGVDGSLGNYRGNSRGSWWQKFLILDSAGDLYWSSKSTQSGRLYHWKEFLEANTPKEEKNMFDMKTMPWMILVNNEAEFDAANGWLVGQGYPSIGCKYPDYCKYLTNTTSRGRVINEVMHGSASSAFRHEIKLNFKTVVDSVEWPVVESERDKKIRELEESAKKIQEQINELKNIKE